MSTTAAFVLIGLWGLAGWALLAAVLFGPELRQRTVVPPRPTAPEPVILHPKVLQPTETPPEEAALGRIKDASIQHIAAHLETLGVEKGAAWAEAQRMIAVAEGFQPSEYTGL